jgi:hypothetical protein
MISSGTGENLKFNSTVSYRICLKGFLDESWSERFNSMAINNNAVGNLKEEEGFVKCSILKTIRRNQQTPTK